MKRELELARADGEEFGLSRVASSMICLPSLYSTEYGISRVGMRKSSQEDKNRLQRKKNPPSRRSAAHRPRHETYLGYYYGRGWQKRKCMSSEVARLRLLLRTPYTIIIRDIFTPPKYRNTNPRNGRWEDGRRMARCS